MFRIVKQLMCQCFIVVMRAGSRTRSHLTSPSVERIRKVSTPSTHTLMQAMLLNEVKLAR